MKNETKLIIKQQSIIEAAHMLGISVRGKRALCYSGHDKNPSLNFNEKLGFFKCFGCGETGDIIKLVQNAKGITFLEACHWLMSAFNIIEDGKVVRKIKIEQVPAAEKPAIRSYNNPDIEIYNWIFSNLNLSTLALSYLSTHRGFSQDIIHKLMIKDIPNPKSFFQLLKAKFGTRRLLDCGLLKSDGEKIRDIWWDHVIVFPFLDSKGHVTYIQGRRLKSDEIKYVNLFNSKPGVYNIRILETMSKNEQLFICEGVPDTITALQMEWKAIGILGAANFDPLLVTKLENFRITVVPDTDYGGLVFFKGIKELFAKRGRTIYKMNLKNYNDLNEYYLRENRKL